MHPLYRQPCVREWQVGDTFSSYLSLLIQIVALHELNPELETRYAANRLGLTRQLHFSPRSEKSLDVTLSLNGIPVATL